ncbi:MAG: Hsp20/alpha crystallin family protein [Candidatus Hodarchaeota archaeon]
MSERRRRRTIFDELRRMRKAIDSMFRDFFGTRFSESDLSEADVWTPPADITETENEIIITADIPGVSKEDIDLRISEDTLEIGAQVRHEEKEEDQGYLRQERRYRRFYRRLPMPMAVKPEEAKAKYNNGVLEIRIPKIEPKKKVSVRIE